MGTCIICGIETDGLVCGSHEEDVSFEFEGTRPDQLTRGRFYRGSVDGFADFGVFVDIGDRVTGLLHTSELPRRLEGLDWDPGDAVYVQVKNVRDNGNVDLGWSIRQHASEFRGRLIDSPEGDRLPEDGEAAPDDDSGNGASSGAAESTDAETGAAGSEPDESRSVAARSSDDESTGDESIEGESESAGGEPSGAESTDAEAADEAESGDSGASEPAAVPGAEALSRTEIGTLADQVGDLVRIEATIVEARQTSGPTIFEVRDETGAVECAAFESAGVRAYPEADAGDAVRIDGVVEERRGDIQVETEALTVLEGAESEAVERRLEEAVTERARPESVDLLADHPAVEAVRDGVVEAATAIRRAVFESRPVVIRHSATVDGYVAGAAVERAVLPLVRGEHAERDAEYHYVDRRPLDGRVYGMGDATRDTTDMLDARERHGEKLPLFVLVNAGSTEESRDGFELLESYGARRVVIDGDHPDDSMADAANAFVSPYLDDDDDGDEVDDGEGVSTTALCANVAAVVNPDARGDLGHLPAVSYWRDVPGAYADLAAEAGYDADATATLREAVALEAFYQAYEAKRELIADLLFDEPGLAEHAAEQFEERVAAEIRTAEPHLDRRSAGGTIVAVLDLDAFTHGYEFPPAPVLLAELEERAGADALVGVDEDSLLVRSGRPVDMREVGERAAEAVPDGGVETRGGRDGTLTFLLGARDAVVDATVEAVAQQL